MSSNDHHIGFVLERIEDDLKAILEGQEALAGVPTQLKDIDDRLGEVETELKAIRAVVTDQSRQLNNHEGRITKLESA